MKCGKTGKIGRWMKHKHLQAATMQTHRKLTWQREKERKRVGRHFLTPFPFLTPRLSSSQRSREIVSLTGAVREHLLAFPFLRKFPDTHELHFDEPDCGLTAGCFVWCAGVHGCSATLL